MTMLDLRGVTAPITGSDVAAGFDPNDGTVNAARLSPWATVLELLGIHVQFGTSATGPWSSSSTNATHFRIATGVTQPGTSSTRWSAAISLGTVIADDSITPDQLNSTNSRVVGYIYGNVNGDVGEWIPPPPRHFSNLLGLISDSQIPASIPRVNNRSFFGTGAPAQILGVDGDTYLDESSGTTYRKESGSWVSRYTDQVGSGGTGVTQAQVNALIAMALTDYRTAVQIQALINATNLSALQGMVTNAQIPAAIARLASPAFTGDPTAPTPTSGDNDTSIATTAFVATAIAALTDSNNVFRFGSGAPAANLGANGDSYLDTNAGIFYSKSSGSWSSQYTDQMGAGGTGVTVAQVNGLIQTALAAAVTGNTETGIDVTYNSDGTFDFVVGSAPAHPTLLGGLSSDATPTAAELTITGANGMIAFGAVTNQRPLIARIASESDITSVVFSNDSSQTNQIGVFTKHGSPVAVDGTNYNVWVGDESVTVGSAFTATVS